MTFETVGLATLSDAEKRAMAHAFAKKAIAAFEKKSFWDAIRYHRYAIQLFQALSAPIYMDQKLTMQCFEALEICYRLTRKFGKAATCRAEKIKMSEMLCEQTQSSVTVKTGAHDFSDLISAYVSEHPNSGEKWIVLQKGETVY